MHWYGNSARQLRGPFDRAKKDITFWRPFGGPWALRRSLATWHGLVPRGEFLGALVPPWFSSYTSNSCNPNLDGWHLFHNHQGEWFLFRFKIMVKWMISENNGNLHRRWIDFQTDLSFPISFPSLFSPRWTSVSKGVPWRPTVPPNLLKWNLIFHCKGASKD